MKLFRWIAAITAVVLLAFLLFFLVRLGRAFLYGGASLIAALGDEPAEVEYEQTPPSPAPATEPEESGGIDPNVVLVPGETYENIVYPDTGTDLSEMPVDALPEDLPPATEAEIEAARGA